MLSSLLTAVAVFLAAVLAAAAADPAVAATRTRASAPAVQAVPAACRWDDPGRSPYMGTLEAAVDTYGDIPRAVRAELKRRMRAHQYDEIADIRRDSITGQAQYAPQLRDMHFGQNKVCARIDRSRWSADHVERGLVYCEGKHCLIVPTVCRNVSRITRLTPPPAVGGDQLVLVDTPGLLPTMPITSPGWGQPGPGPLPPLPTTSPEPGTQEPPLWPALPPLLPAPAGPPLEMPPSPVGTPYVNPFPPFPGFPPVPLPVVPEPGTGVLFSLGLLAAAARWGWRRRRAAAR